MILYSSIIFITAFFMGSLPTGYLVARTKGINIKSVGSGNIGATVPYLQDILHVDRYRKTTMISISVVHSAIIGQPVLTK